MTWVETGSGTSPICAATCASTAGSTLAKVPTGPEIAQVAISRRAACSRSAARANSAWWPASLSPKLVGSAWTPWLRPTQRVCLCSKARRSSAAATALDAAFEQGAGAVELHREAGIEDVRRGEALVDEARLRADMVGEIGEEGDDVVAGLALDRIDLLGIDQRGMVGADRTLKRRRRCRRRLAERDLGIERMALDLEPDGEPGLRRPDRGHLRARITRDHGLSRRGIEPLLRYRRRAWLGRQDSNLGSRDQNPLPCHLATPQAVRLLARGGAARKRATQPGSS